MSHHCSAAAPELERTFRFSRSRHAANYCSSAFRRLRFSAGDETSAMARPKLIHPGQPLVVRAILGLYEFFASLKLAVVLILLLAIVLGMATFVEANFGTAAVGFLIYHTWFFAALSLVAGSQHLLCGVDSLSVEAAPDRLCGHAHRLADPVGRLGDQRSGERQFADARLPGRLESRGHRHGPVADLDQRHSGTSRAARRPVPAGTFQLERPGALSDHAAHKVVGGNRQFEPDVGAPAADALQRRQNQARSRRLLLAERRFRAPPT